MNNQINNNLERAKRINDVISMPGWIDIQLMYRELVNDTRNDLLDIMAKKPDTLTGKTAIKYAVKVKTLQDFMESIIDEVKILPQNRVEEMEKLVSQVVDVQ